MINRIGVLFSKKHDAFRRYTSRTKVSLDHHFMSECYPLQGLVSPVFVLKHAHSNATFINTEKMKLMELVKSFDIGVTVSYWSQCAIIVMNTTLINAKVNHHVLD